MNEVDEAHAERPSTGYPFECIEGVVFFDRCLTEEEKTEDEYQPWVRDYSYSWRRECSVVFGQAITGVKRKVPPEDKKSGKRNGNLQGPPIFSLDLFECDEGEGDMYVALKRRLPEFFFSSTAKSLV